MPLRIWLTWLTLALLGALLVMATACKSSRAEALPELTPFPPELEERLHGIRDKVAGVRGLAINEDAEEGQLSRDALRQYIEKETAKVTEEDRQELEAYNIAFRLLHLIGPDDDLIDLVSGSVSEHTLGFFVAADNKLVLVAGQPDIGPQDEIVLAHEYVHSFQHRAFDMDKLEDLLDHEDGDQKSRTEYDSTISCLKEGDASLGMAQYGKAVYGPEWYDATFGLDDAEAPASEADIPPAIERYLAFDYNECVRFAQSLYDDGGWDAVDRAYADPPWTTEQILHPKKYRSRETLRSGPPESLEKTLGGGWDRLDLDVFGEFDVYNYLATVLNDEFTASIAASGWGSGWTAVYTADADGETDPQDVLIHLRLDWDTDGDFQEFLSAYAFAVDTVSGGKWTLDGEDGPVRWEAAGEYGYITWNRTLNRVEIVITTQEQARDDVRTGL